MIFRLESSDCPRFNFCGMFVVCSMNYGKINFHRFNWRSSLCETNGDHNFIANRPER